MVSQSRLLKCFTSTARQFGTDPLPLRQPKEVGRRNGTSQSHKVASRDWHSWHSRVYTPPDQSLRLHTAASQFDGCLRDPVPELDKLSSRRHAGVNPRTWLLL